MTVVRQTPLPRRVSGYVLLIIFAIIFIGPFLIQLATSFKTPDDAASNPLSLIPNPFSVEAWKQVLGITGIANVDFPRWLGNTAFIAIVLTVGRVFLDSLAAYALARLQFPGRKLVFLLVIGTLAVPNVVLLIPRFLVIKELGLYNSYGGMILPIIADAGGIFIMRQFFLQVPVALEEAARIDGASTFRTYWSVVLPVVRPGLLTLTILSFQSSWNEFSFFLVANSDPNKYTLPVGLHQLTTGSLGSTPNFPLNMGAALLATIPLAIIFFIFQRHFTGGQLSGGVKG
ncbi:MAG: carbohydrate ABC transporter permease [Acidimicrobiaceae bacterium]|nr:carbohydrate ABC transporter permease [Acidimicrobiaceae bacterium]